MTDQADEIAAIAGEERDFLTRVRDGRALKMADRKEDRMRQKLRRRGLVVVEKNPRRWVITAAGRAHLENPS